MTTANEQPRVFKSMAVALKELEPYIRNGQHLQTGRPFENFTELRSRELLCNWLICAAVNASSNSDRAMFSSDPDGGDGLLWDKATAQSWPTEHVMVPNLPQHIDPIDTRILTAIAHKQARGPAYGDGKILVVFPNAGNHDAWFPNRLARQIPKPNHFDQIWVAGLKGLRGDQYVYNVTRLEEPHSPAWRVIVEPDFQNWTVEAIQ